MFRSRIWTTTGLSTIWAAEALAQTVSAPPVARPDPPALPEIARAAPGGRPAGWTLATLPKQSLPVTDLRVERPDSSPPVGAGTAAEEPALALRVESRASYGALMHEWPQRPVPDAQWRLSWAWRLDRPLAAADLRAKAGDDAALKVCLMFDPPLSALPFGERARLQIARAVSGQPLPAATLCYVWDTQLPAGTELPNAHSARVRYLVLDGTASPVGTWQRHTRAVLADLQRAFGSEVAAPTPLIGIAVGADSDNTGGHSLGWVAALGWSR